LQVEIVHLCDTLAGMLNPEKLLLPEAHIEHGFSAASQGLSQLLAQHHRAMSAGTKLHTHLAAAPERQASQALHSEAQPGSSAAASQLTRPSASTSESGEESPEATFTSESLLPPVPSEDAGQTLSQPGLPPRLRGSGPKDSSRPESVAATSAAEGSTAAEPRIADKELLHAPRAQARPDRASRRARPLAAQIADDHMCVKRKIGLQCAQFWPPDH
jgi:hypothetical protein